MKHMMMIHMIRKLTEGVLLLVFVSDSGETDSRVSVSC